MADQLAAALDATASGTYRQRGITSLQRLFRVHYPELLLRYDAEFATRLGYGSNRYTGRGIPRNPAWQRTSRGFSNVCYGTSAMRQNRQSQTEGVGANAAVECSEVCGKEARMAS